MFNPKYTISNQMLSQLSEIAEIKSIVERSKLLPKREVFLKRTSIIKMAHTSTSIEGNELQEYQVANVANGKKISGDQNQITEVTNYLSALGEINKISELKKNIAAKDILNIHKITMNGLVTSEKLGNWRKGPVYVVNILPSGKEEIAYSPPSFIHVSEHVSDLLDWLNSSDKIHPIIRTGLFHYQFETIHPFTDGNGRTGRLLSLLHLYQSDWDFKKILVLEDYYNRNRKAYYEALQTGKTFIERSDADLTNWLEYYVEGFLDEANNVKTRILTLSGASSSKERNVLDLDELKIVDFVLSLGQITSSDVVDILNVPQRTAQSKLKKLEDIKVLEKKGAGPATHYIIAGIA
ncbi:hypothetical protein CO178_00380 [candidate division WWE3 bacterium CG_4_9_14_3_um_filter_34_6]|uniref:Fido domain-containing protein n=1 Tax=candidate division WWE3 bacterium CG_4_9_14_3_um_filter_34_6 TaxID=1975079 RepID=A0A2M7X594_UNCKA|nr:MAG: hypothetical protein CO178_00380 [candidate division WWE3 bacterium CG_4_9_14_3_um_filter_34_6]